MKYRVKKTLVSWDMRLTDSNIIERKWCGKRSAFAVQKRAWWWPFWNDYAIYLDEKGAWDHAKWITHQESR